MDASAALQQPRHSTEDALAQLLLLASKQELSQRSQGSQLG